MRISGGTLRGKRITCPAGTIRPAMERMRESMFSILDTIAERSFLDLFSGSGLVAIEAWSRGARPVVMVERDRVKRRTILDNVDELTPQPTLRIEPVERFVQRNRTAFDIVYLDPPFDYRYKHDLLQRLVASGTLHDASIVLIHAPTSETLPDTISRGSRSISRYDRRTYGGSTLTFYRVDAAVTTSS